MVLTDFTITAADVGRALGVPDGYLVNFVMTQGPAYETPSVDEGKQKFASGYLCCAEAAIGGTSSASPRSAAATRNGGN
jgi:hypothetical protein